jgi:hypothetical protein
LERWKRQFNKEKPFIKKFESEHESLRHLFLNGKKILSDNFDTVVSLDFPHYCNSATLGCGGGEGWCYTLVGHQVSAAHAEKVAATDVFCRKYPQEFAQLVAAEVHDAVRRGKLPYPNLRISGSGEISPSHITGLLQIIQENVHIWGFSKNIDLIEILNSQGAHFLFSMDSTTPEIVVAKASSAKVGIAYTSTSVTDHPTLSPKVVFPLHKVGRVGEVVDHAALCPKVIDEYLNGQRMPASCQSTCNRCHEK